MQEIKFDKWHEIGVVNYRDEPHMIKQSNKRLQRILGKNYYIADLEKEVAKLIHLSSIQQEALLVYLKKYEPLFNGEF